MGTGQVSWIPFLELIAIPVAVVGLLLSGIGVLIAIFKGGRGLRMPLLAGFLCILPIVVSFGSTGATRSAISTAFVEAAAIEADKKSSALSDLVIEDVQWNTKDVFGDLWFEVSYKLNNNSEVKIKTVSARIKFYNAKGTEIGHELENPVSIFDSDLHPGNIIEKESNSFDFQDISADLVESVAVEVEGIQ